MTILKMVKDIAGHNTFGLPFSSLVYRAVLSQNVEETLTIPPATDSIFSAFLAIISYAGNSNALFVSNNQTVTVPISSSFTGGFGPLNPYTSRYVLPGDVLHFITPDDIGYVTVELFQCKIGGG